MKKKVVVVGAGFGGLSAAAYLARDGYDVTGRQGNDHE
jgi:phytoene desaturase